MNIYFSQKVRATEWGRASKIGEAQVNSGYARRWEVLAVEGQDADAVDFLSIFPSDKIVKFMGKEMDWDRFQSTVEALECPELENCTIRSGNHSTAGALLAKVFGHELPPIPCQITSQEEAALWEIKDNMANNLSEKLKNVRLRLLAVEKYKAGEYRTESDLMRDHGYLKGQAMNSHNTSKLVVDEGFPLKEVIKVTSQKALSKLAKEPNVTLEMIIDMQDGIKVKALTKADRQKIAVDFKGTIIADLLYAHDWGDKAAFYTFCRDLEEAYRAYNKDAII